MRNIKKQVWLWGAATACIFTLAACQLKAPDSSTGMIPVNVIQSFGAAGTNWRAWDALHEKEVEWIGIDDTDSEISDPLMSKSLFFSEFDSEISPEEAAKKLISDLLDSMSTDADNRQFTILEYAIPEQTLHTRADVIENALRMLDSGEAPSQEGELEEWCKFYFGLHPGLDDDMWFLYPQFSFKWSGLCGVSEYEELANEVVTDANGFVSIENVLARSPEANIFLLAKANGGYYFQNADAFYASHE